MFKQQFTGLWWIFAIQWYEGNIYLHMGGYVNWELQELFDC